MLADNGNVIIAQEGRPPRHHLIEHRSQRIQVGLRHYLSASGPFREHVADRADHHLFLRETGAVY